MFHTQLHIPSSNARLITIIKLKAQYRKPGKMQIVFRYLLPQ